MDKHVDSTGNRFFHNCFFITGFSHTGSLEVYHSLLNKWVPKSNHFSYEGMIVQSQLAATDLNLGTDPEQKTTKMG